MRLDRYLFFVRLLKSRTQAQALIDTGRVRIDGRHVVKCSEEIRTGSTVTLPLHGHVRVIRVTALPARRGPAAEARLHYEELAANVSQQAPAD
ncbi:RNA-binding S4 domain-containing protein [Sphingomonas jaspsi]|uniref:RNA-binding S4 domain-containing protein n=1 Tax=Sphingomonas jaspsi TaxID=392409 RepID=UPI0004B4CA1F|nr:RNA-binding S4 domain-containing protein [Sphingomonas jaspsi]